MLTHRPPQSPLLVVAIQLGLLILVLYYTFIGGHTAQVIYDHQWRLVTLWLTHLIIGSWLMWRLIRRYPIPATPFDLPLLCLLLSWGLATLFSVNPMYSQETLFFFIGYLLLFFMAADVGRWSWLAELFVNALIAVAGLIWMLALLQLGWWFEDATQLAQVLGDNKIGMTLPRLSVLGNPNTMASFIALVTPLVLYKITTAHKLTTRLLLVLWAVLLTGAVLLTQSRGGLLAFVTGSGVYASLWFFHKCQIDIFRQNTKSLKFILGLTGITVVGLFALLAWLVLQSRSLGPAVDIRWRVMTGAITTWLHHPFFGSGPGTLGQELLAHQERFGSIWPDAHNLVLTFLAETGLVGGLILLWLIGVGIKLLWSVAQPAGQRQWLSLACAAALLGFMAHNLVDFLYKFPLLMILVAILGGFWVSPHLSTPQRDQVPHSIMRRNGRAIVALILLIANIFIGLQSVENVKAYNQAVEAAQRNEWPSAVEHLETATRMTGQTPFYQRQLAFTLGHMADARPKKAVVYRQQAIDHYQQAFKTVNHLPNDQANVACLLWADDQPQAALEAITRASNLAPNNLLYRLNLGYYLEQEEADEAAKAEYRFILTTTPRYLESSYWQQTALRQEVLAELPQQMASLETDERIDLYLAFGMAEAALQTYLQSSDTDYLGHGQILLQLGYLDEARRIFETAVEINPRTATAHLFLSKIALTRNDLRRAERHAEAARLLQPAGDTLYQSAQVAERLGNADRASGHYAAAFRWLTTQDDSNLTRYATEVARRRPLPASYLPCVQRLYPTDRLVQIAAAWGGLLERREDYRQAASVYRQLLAREPDASSIAAKLTNLCQKQPEVCS